jgi:5-methyltetrahydropteroyltriglutamate--homocysteine methyltransferase
MPGSPENGPLTQAAINRILDKVNVQKAVHFCFGNYGGQTILSGNWQAWIDFLNSLHTDHLVLELAHRPDSDLDALKQDMAQGIQFKPLQISSIQRSDTSCRLTPLWRLL